jgi:hypothetical protein
MENPYASPASAESSGPAAEGLFYPALGILILSIIWLFLAATNAVFYGSRLSDPEYNDDSRQFATIMLLYVAITSVYSLALALGAVNMLRMKSYLWAMVTAILAMVPMLGPCYLLAIPFGLRAFLTLRKLEVKVAFERR